MSTVAFLYHSLCHNAVMFLSSYCEHCRFSLSLCVTVLSYFGFLIMSNAVFVYHSLCHHAFMFLSPYYEHCRFYLSLYVSMCCHILVSLLCAMPFSPIILCVTMLSCFCHLIMSTVAFICHSMCHRAVYFGFLIMSNAVFLYHSLCLLIMSTVAFLFHCMFHRAVIFLFCYYMQCRFSLSFSASPCFHGFVTLL